MRYIITTEQHTEHGTETLDADYFCDDYCARRWMDSLGDRAEITDEHIFSTAIDARSTVDMTVTYSGARTYIFNDDHSGPVHCAHCAELLATGLEYDDEDEAA